MTNRDGEELTAVYDLVADYGVVLFHVFKGIGVNLVGKLSETSDEDIGFILVLAEDAPGDTQFI